MREYRAKTPTIEAMQFKVDNPQTWAVDALTVLRNAFHPANYHTGYSVWLDIVTRPATLDDFYMYYSERADTAYVDKDHNRVKLEKGEFFASICDGDYFVRNSHGGIEIWPRKKFEQEFEIPV